MKVARYEVLEDGSFYGEVEDLKGVWANADTLEGTREELEEVLEEWLALRLSKNLPNPPSAGPRFRLLPLPDARRMCH